MTSIEMSWSSPHFCCVTPAHSNIRVVEKRAWPIYNSIELPYWKPHQKKMDTWLDAKLTIGYIGARLEFFYSSIKQYYLSSQIPQSKAKILLDRALKNYQWRLFFVLFPLRACQKVQPTSMDSPEWKPRYLYYENLLKNILKNNEESNINYKMRNIN